MTGCTVRISNNRNRTHLIRLIISKFPTIISPGTWNNMTVVANEKKVCRRLTVPPAADYRLLGLTPAKAAIFWSDPSSNICKHRCSSSNMQHLECCWSYTGLNSPFMTFVELGQWSCCAGQTPQQSSGNDGDGSYSLHVQSHRWTNRRPAETEQSGVRLLRTDDTTPDL